MDTTTGVEIRCGNGSISTTRTVGLAPGTSPAQNCAGNLFDSTAGNLVEINGDGFGVTVIGAITIEGMAHDRTNDVVYGTDNGSFFSIDLATGAILSDLAGPLE